MLSKAHRHNLEQQVTQFHPRKKKDERGAHQQETPPLWRCSEWAPARPHRRGRAASGTAQPEAFAQPAIPSLQKILAKTTQLRCVEGQEEEERRARKAGSGVQARYENECTKRYTILRVNGGKAGVDDEDEGEPARPSLPFDQVRSTVDEGASSVTSSLSLPPPPPPLSHARFFFLSCN